MQGVSFLFFSVQRMIMQGVFEVILGFLLASNSSRVTMPFFNTRNPPREGSLCRQIKIRLRRSESSKNLMKKKTKRTLCLKAATSPQAEEGAALAAHAGDLNVWQ